MLRFFAGAAFGGSSVLDVGTVSVVVAAASWLATTWAIYLLNGVADIVEDRENRSTRPIALGHLPDRTAARIAWLLAVLGLVGGMVVSTTMLLLVALMLFVGWAYSMGPCPLKRGMAGFTVGVTALGLLTYLAGWCAAGAGGPRGSIMLFGIMMSLWMGLAGSTKDLSDTKGDRSAGRRTLPVILGERRARMVMAVEASLVGWTFGILAIAWFDQLLPVAAVVWGGSAALAIVALTAIGDGDRSAKRRPYRVFMITQYLAHITLFVSGAPTIGG